MKLTSNENQMNFKYYNFDKEDGEFGIVFERHKVIPKI